MLGVAALGEEGYLVLVSLVSAIRAKTPEPFLLP